MARLERKHPYEAESPVLHPKVAFDSWIAQTRDLAYEIVYERGALRPGTSRENAPVLQRDYIERTRAVDADQIASAGNRTGALLGCLR